MKKTPIKRALLSVADKTDIIWLAKKLIYLNIEIIATGGTYALLQQHGIAAITVSDFTAAAEMLHGRVKTLHPAIHGAILARRDADEAEIAEHNLKLIDLVVVNLYPFTETVAKQAAVAEVIENIDIGGSTMLRAAAKNFDWVTVVANPQHYAVVVNELQQQQAISSTTRATLAAAAFKHTATYEAAIANYFANSVINNGDENSSFDLTAAVNSSSWQLKQQLRYGENPSQQAALFINENAAGGIAAATQLQGKELSFNNLADADSAWQCVQQLQQPACAIVKHANPCGIAVANDIATAYAKAYVTDPISAFGGIIAVNRELDAATAAKILSNQFVEVIVAPAISADAKKSFSNKPNVRVLQVKNANESNAIEYKTISGGLLAQTTNNYVLQADEIIWPLAKTTDEKLIADLIFAFNSCKHVKSNAIVFVKDGATLAIGAGQMSRIFSMEIAVLKAKQQGIDITGSVLASDAFFPFADGVELAAKLGVKAVIAPCGSKNDEAVIAAATANNIILAFTKMRNFKH